MKICKKCGESFPYWSKINGELKNLRSRQYCLTCSPYKEGNTRKIESVQEGEESICKKCGKKYIYNRKAGHRKETCNSCIVMKSQRKKKRYAVEQYGEKCTRCGYNRCIDALEFHHRNESEKEEHASYIIYRWTFEKAKKELDKCDLLCANCHREIHSKEFDKDAGVV